MMITCTLCTYQAGENEAGRRQMASHLQRNHNHKAVVKDTATGRILGTALRANPQALLICYASGCNFEADSWRQLEGHIKKSHNKNKSVSVDLVAFPDAILTSGNINTSESANQASRGVTETRMTHAHSASLDSAVRRTLRPRSTDRMQPYPQISPRGSRSPSPIGRGRSTTITRDPSPMGRGISPSGSFPTTPVIPSPLNQILFSRPVSPTVQSEVQTTTSESIGQYMDVETEEALSQEEKTSLGGNNDSSDEIEPSPPPREVQMSSPTGTNQDDKEMDESEAWTDPDVFLNVYSLRLVRLTKSGQFPVPQFLACSVCSVGVPPKSAVAHVKSHARKLSNSNRRLLESWINLQSLASTCAELPVPIRKEAPFSALQVHTGFACRKCGFSGTAEVTMRMHSSTAHSVSTGWRETIREASLQTFFPGNAIYFEVASAFEVPSRSAVLKEYRARIKPKVQAVKDSLPMPTSSLDVGPLLRITQWHLHLADYLASKLKTKSLLTLMQLPTSRHGEQHLGNPLHKTIHEYMMNIKGKADAAPLGVRCLLMECPRTNQSGDVFKPVSEESLPRYGLLLHHWTHALLLSIKGHDSGYRFPLNDSDLENAAALEAILKTKDRQGAVEAFHRFIKNILYPRPDIDTGGLAVKWTDPIECLFALSALRDGGIFKKAYESTQMISHATYHIRGAILFEGYANRALHGNSLYRAVEHEALKNLSPGLATPYNICIDYNRFISALAYNTNPAPNTLVSKDGLSISFSEHTLHIAKWRSGLRTVMDEAKDILSRLCLGMENTIRIRLDVKDNWREETRGYGWTTRVAYLENPGALMEALIIHPTWQMGSLVNGKFQYNTNKAWEYMHLADDLMDRLLFLTYNTIGQSPRIRELLDYTFVNGIRPREMFMDDEGVIWLATRRVKTETQTGIEKFLPMKCHPELSQAFREALVLVRPVQEELGFALSGETTQQIYSEYLWVRAGQRLKDRDVYNMMQTFFQKYCGVGLGVYDYRQISIEIGRVFLGSEAEMDDEELDVIAAQAGHSLHMARWKYAPEVGRLPNTGSDVMLRYARASEKWWEITGFRPGVPPMLPLRTRVALRGDLYSNSAATGNTNPTTMGTNDIQMILQAVGALSKEIVQLKSTVATRTEMQNLEVMVRKEMREGLAEAMAAPLVGNTRLAGQSSIVTVNDEPTRLPFDSSTAAADDSDDMYVDSPEEFAAVSSTPAMSSTAFPALPAFTPPPLSRVVFGSSTPQPATQVITTPYHPGPGVQKYLEDLLQKHFPAMVNPKFKSLAQMEAVEMAIARKENFVAVLPTGGGKSLIFTLPAFNERTSDRPFQTFAIIPNKSLLQDTIRKTRKVGIEVIQWKSDMSHEVDDGVQLVLLALETAAGEKFRTFWSYQENRAIRLVLDEAHQVLASQEFRPKFGKIHLLAQLKVQKIFLTASLPIRLEKIFLREVGLPANTKIIRARADQPQISYNRVDFSSMTTQNIIRLAIDVARCAERFMDHDQIGMIFCMSIGQAKALHEEFTHCSSYSERPFHQRMDDEAQWRSGRHRWIATTTGMIQGIDAPNIGVTLFLGMPYGLLNLYQGAGRGGRDGRKSWAIVLNQTNQMIAFDSKFEASTEDTQCIREGIEWCKTSSSHCRRYWLSQLLDGIPKACAELENGHFCDICDTDSLLMKSIQPIIDDPPPPVPSTSTFVHQPSNQSLTHSAPQQKIVEDEYDLLNVDFDFSLEGIEALSRRANISNRPAPAAMDVDPPMQPPSHLVPPTTNEPSLAVLRDTSYYHSVMQTKDQKAWAVSRLASMLLGRCAVCWAKYDILRYKHEHIWKNCGDPSTNKGFIGHMVGWIDMKHRIQFKKRFVYCWKCQLPQEEKYRPSVHPPLDTGDKGKKPCPLEDLAILIIWYIRWTPEWWARALQAFPSLRHNMGETEFGKWLKDEVGPENFYNGLELVLWFFTEKTRTSS